MERMNFMRRYEKMKNIFADKATLILRMMLKEPQRKWVVRDFTGQQGVSVGTAQSVLETMAKKGYVERIKKGPDSYTQLTNQEKLVSDWLKEYQCELNEVDTYYSPDKYILRKIKDSLDSAQYALTLHTGANLITSFVRTEEVFMYMNLKEWNRELMKIKQKLELRELVRGGNIHILRPFYKNTVFFNAQKIKGYPVVSNLQLFIDLYNYQPRGREHAEQLKSLLEDKGKRLA